MRLTAAKHLWKNNRLFGSNVFVAAKKLEKQIIKEFMLDYKQYIASKIDVDMDKAELAQAVTEIADDKLGDYAFPCFQLAKTLRKAPPVIASDIANQIGDIDFIDKLTLST